MYKRVDDVFDGTMILIKDEFGGYYQAPGWICRFCGWKIGTADLPPPHNCVIGMVVVDSVSTLISNN